MQEKSQQSLLSISVVSENLIMNSCYLSKHKTPNSPLQRGEDISCLHNTESPTSQQENTGTGIWCISETPYCCVTAVWWGSHQAEFSSTSIQGKKKKSVAKTQQAAKNKKSFSHRAFWHLHSTEHILIKAMKRHRMLLSEQMRGLDLWLSAWRVIT